MKLTNVKVKALDKAGMHGDGRGLYLRVSGTGTKSWILRATVGRRRRDIGLGGYPAVTLAAARKAADEQRAKIAAGADPIAERRRSAIPTFKEAAEAVHAGSLAGWSNGKHTSQWINTLRTYAFPQLGRMTVDQIRRADVIAVLEPIWTAKPETARRVRQRIRAVLNWALAREFVEYNAAGEGIEAGLPIPDRAPQHFRALPYAELPEALETVEATNAGMAVRLCLRFLILTASRSGEARGAQWNEIDFEARTWTVPAERMKGRKNKRRAHRVPLSEAALAVLREADELRDRSGYVFPSPQRRGRPLSDMALTKALRDSSIADKATIHGFRSCFRDWGSENTNAPVEVMERALAHVEGNAVIAAYDRSDLLEKRRLLMEQWGEFVTRPSGGAQVVRLHERE